MHRGVGIPIGATPVKTIALAFIIGSLLIPLTQTLVHGSAGPSLTNTTVTVTLAFRPTDFTFDTIDGYDRVTTASGGLTTAVGAPMLGVPRAQRASLQTNEDYQRLFVAYRKHLITQKGELGRLVELSRQKRLALVCFEKDPMCCHRHVLGEELRKHGAEVTIE